MTEYEKTLVEIVNELIRGTLNKSIEWTSKGLPIASPDHVNHGLMALSSNVEEITQLDFKCTVCGKNVKVCLYGDNASALYIEGNRILTYRDEFLSYYITNPMSSLRGCLLDLDPRDNPYSMHIQDFLKELKNR